MRTAVVLIGGMLKPPSFRLANRLSAQAVVTALRGADYSVMTDDDVLKRSLAAALKVKIVDPVTLMLTYP